MCHPSVLAFVEVHLSAGAVAGRRVLEVGSQDINGSARYYLQRMAPLSYLGVDSAPGVGVDRVLPAERLVSQFGEQAFDIVIATEMLEHARDWRACLWNMMAVLCDGGLLVLTTRSSGFPYHGFPEDHWRFSRADAVRILEGQGFWLRALQDDPLAPGIFLIAQRPPAWRLPPLESCWLDIRLERAPPWPP
jgi:hypothetical protein